MFLNKGSIYKFFSLLTPPVLFLALKKSRIYPKMKIWADRHLKKDHHKPEWCKITGGLLFGYDIYIDPNGIWKDMISGSYDSFFFNYLERMDLDGKVILDIGAHVGYSSMCFAKLVGNKGHVYAFEPNVFNKKRFEYILSKNNDLEKIISIFDVAISDKEGEDDFVFSDNVDNGTSSGSFIDSSNTFFTKGTYEYGFNFKRVKTKTIPINLLPKIGIDHKPDLLKIDIEGAEHLALSGGKEFIKEHKPVLLIEIHSIFNMLKCCQILSELNYGIELLKEESDGRCFIACKPQ